MSVMHAPPTAPLHPSTGARLVTRDGQVLPFLGGRLHATASGGVARVVLRARFENPTEEALRVTWQVPLPADAAVSGFAFELSGERIVGEVDGTAAARERFEEALVEGRTAALLEQDRAALFTQEVGNLPPGEQVTCELILDQRLRWHGPTGGWEWRFPTVVAPRFLGAAGRVADAERVTVDLAPDGEGPRMTLQLSVGDALTGALSSPSHALQVGPGAPGSAALAAAAALDRDLVVRWPVAASTAGASLAVARSTAGAATDRHAAGLLTLIPPARAQRAVPRDLVVLLDTSGSMGGAPLRQAQAVTCALIESLGDADQLQLVEFSTRPSAWRGAPVAATAAHRADATRWVRALRAGGGTCMKEGILAALSRLRGEATRQVILVTDGLIGFEKEIIGAIADGLPRGCVVHTLGIGSGVNRGLLGPAARAGGGLELIVGLDEDPTEAAADVVAATAAPQVVDVEITGSAVQAVAIHRCPDLLAGRPVRVALQLDPAGGEVRIQGQTADGPWSHRVTVPPTAPGAGDPAVVTLLGREQVEDLELAAAQGADQDDAIEALGLRYQIATRRTSWVAVSQQTTVDATAPTRAVRVPQALPHGMSVAALGLRAAAPPVDFAGATLLARAAPLPPTTLAMRAFMDDAPSPTLQRKLRRKPPGRLRRLREALVDALPPAPAAEEDTGSFPSVATGNKRGEHRPERRLAARIVVTKAGRLVLEIAVPAAGLTWALPATVTVRLADGRRLQATVDRRATTKPQDLLGGTVARLALRLEDFDPSGDVPVEVDLRAGGAARLVLDL